MAEYSPAVDKELEAPGTKKQIRVYGIAKNDHQDAIAKMLDAKDINCMGISEPDDIAVEKTAAMPIDALVLYASSFTEDLQDWVRSFKKTRIGVIVLLATDQLLDVELLQRAMDCGVQSVVFANAESSGSVAEAVRKEVHKREIREESAKVLHYGSHVIVTYSSKGGAGKTTVAVNLAATLSSMGKKVSIIDLDLACGDVHSFLGINNNNSIAELADELSITPATIKEYVKTSASGISVMCAPAVPQHGTNVTPELVARVITTLRVESDYVIIDTDQQVVSGAIAKCNEEAMKAADLILFVVTPEVPTINGAHDMLGKYLIRYPNVMEKVRLVVNKADSYSTISAEEVAKTLNKKLFIAIPDDYNTVVQTLNTGVPFMTEKPTGYFANLFRRPIKKTYEQMAKMIDDSFTQA